MEIQNMGKIKQTTAINAKINPKWIEHQSSKNQLHIQNLRLSLKS